MVVAPPAPACPPTGWPSDGPTQWCSELDGASIEKVLSDLPSRIRAATGTDVLTRGRNLVVRLSLPLPRGPLDVVAKLFPEPTAWDRMRGRSAGDKAWRTWQAARHLAAHRINTPAPLALLPPTVDWPGGCYLSRYEPGLASFKDELNRLFRHHPDCAAFMGLLETVARGIRRLHDSGFEHRDLGNQNILLRRQAESCWSEVVFLDLNRGRWPAPLSEATRGRDLSRLWLPSDLRRVFFEMYWGAAAPPPAGFLAAEQAARRWYAWHHLTRAWRHPLREQRLRRHVKPEDGYPAPRDLWIWDERSGQPICPFRSRDRHRYQRRRDIVVQLGAVAASLPSILPGYQRLIRQAYIQPLSMVNRVGLGMSPDPATFERERAEMAPLGTLPVLVRCAHHLSSERKRFVYSAIETLAGAGHPITIAFLQDRRAVREPDLWRRFVATSLEAVAGHVEAVEFGHAINRVKWGVWDRLEYTRLMAPLEALRRAHPGLRWYGPSCIDFEYPAVLAALRALPGTARFNGLAHELYVDRRGAPEHAQGCFSLLEKLALARAIAQTSGRTGDELVISEVNWPLAGTGVFSPVGAPYESPGPRFDDPSVSESDYADFMLRYLLIALCSGFATRVFWWRLVAHGYGLIDDHAATAWRRRPAWECLRHFLTVCAPARFVGRLPTPPATHAMKFSAPDGETFIVAWSSDHPSAWRPPGTFGYVTDATGRPFANQPSDPLTGHPRYFREFKPA